MIFAIKVVSFLRIVVGDIGAGGSSAGAGRQKRFRLQGPVKMSALEFQGACDAEILSVRYIFSGAKARRADETFLSACPGGASIRTDVPHFTAVF
jgi:hypothetical protein